MRGRTTKWPFQSGAVLLLAAGLVLQICASSANPLSNSATAPAAISVGGCCNNGSSQGCAGLDAAEAADTCARHCAQPSHDPASTLSGLPVSSVIPYVISARPVEAAFPDRPSGLNAAPRAISSTPLIYHLQRLLN